MLRTPVEVTRAEKTTGSASEPKIPVLHDGRNEHELKGWVYGLCVAFVSGASVWASVLFWNHAWVGVAAMAAGGPNLVGAVSVAILLPGSIVVGGLGLVMGLCVLTCLCAWAQSLLHQQADRDQQFKTTFFERNP